MSIKCSRKNVHSEQNCLTNEGAMAEESPALLPSSSYGGCTLEEVAAELGISVGRARQIEFTALRKLRFLCRRYGWDYQLLMGD